MGTYKSYHLAIKMAFALRVEKELLPESFRKKIPRSTAFYWKDLDHRGFKVDDQKMMDKALKKRMKENSTFKDCTRNCHS